MFNFNLDPVLFNFWIFEIRYYGLVYVIGFLLVYLFLYKKRESLGIDKNNLERLMLYLILSTVIFARLFHVIFSEASFYFNNLIEIFKFWKGGMSFFGGLFGSLLVSYYFCKKFSVNFYKLGDLIVIPAAFGLFLGRIANFVNGELWGKVSNVDWCFVYNNVCRHPYQLYEAFGRFLVLLILIGLSFKKFKRGMLFWMFIFLINLSRFVNEFFRDNLKIFLGMSGWQILSLSLILVSLYVLIKDYRKLI